MQGVAPPDLFGPSPNNNAASAVDVIDEHGNLLQRLEQFNFFNIFLLDMGSYLQVSPTTSTGYTLGPGGTQLAPFHYSTDEPKRVPVARRGPPTAGPSCA